MKLKKVNNPPATKITVTMLVMKLGRPVPTSLYPLPTFARGLVTVPNVLAIVFFRVCY